jgi:halocyanin-like protein
MTRDTRHQRRDVLRGAAGVATGTAIASTPAVAQDSGTPFDGFFDNTSNFDDIVDKTGQAEIRIIVGAEGNDGAFAFGPAAIRVDPGTTVIWEWSGKGGGHNVVAQDGRFESALTDEAGHTFSHTFDSVGSSTYVCVPHEMMGMKGAVIVGQPSESGLATMEGKATVAGTVGLDALLFGLFLRGTADVTPDSDRSG